ncbi:MAG: hypothetical protein FD122_3742 [Stygiobacter sp.]|nr:MAG: hypothetical protein FD122_3742 [Stygiobacter sp.]
MSIRRSIRKRPSSVLLQSRFEYDIGNGSRSDNNFDGNKPPVDPDMFDDDLHVDAGEAISVLE